ncbi:hypothetical protein HK097_009690 [Rhizophlyctis rosea]|uniref:Mitochondrial splicing suppressor 51-like C-terminal domain-containing protein n=1 Tax=Rhizophlyctis rosea TaxID=64517 RepID=A0AAD5X3M2_9FUNG|nr:hypothetical protein HK097_009690 [Rhizophlyctis rosea]
MAVAGGSAGYNSGQSLARTEFPSDKDAWKIPRFANSAAFLNDYHIPPEVRKILNGRILADWPAYYGWECQPPVSVTPILMNFPITADRLLRQIPSLLKPRNNDKPLQIHLLGIEHELDFIALWAELAHLLPHIEIVLTFCTQLLWKLLVSMGRLAVLLNESLTSSAIPHRKTLMVVRGTNLTSDWSESILYGRKNGPPSARQILITVPSKLKDPTTQKPSAVIAINAGLRNYRSWRNVPESTFTHSISLAVSEYCEQALEIDREVLLPRYTRSIGDLIKVVIARNPFQDPGRKGHITVKVP